MQTSITTWFQKSSAVKQSIASSQTKDSTPTTTPTPQTHPDISTSPQTQQQTQQTHPTTEQKPLFTTPPKPLVKNITLVPCSEHHIPAFQRLNTLLLPIPYPPSFYREILSDATAKDLTLLALWHDDNTSSRVVGGIRCRILPSPSDSQETMLYISTLCVLSPFREFGIATHLLRRIVARAVSGYGVRFVGAHVWEENQEARVWYRKRGFVEVRKEEAYYRRLSPMGAFVVRREIGVNDLLGFGDS